MPVLAPRRLPMLARLAALFGGLTAFGASLALMVQAHLGLSPWDVLNQGVAARLGIRIGWATMVVGGVVLLAWIPLRQKPGFGTVCNVIVVGLAANATLVLLPSRGVLMTRAGFLAGGIVLNAFATALYIGAGFGAGPRDGLMTGLARGDRSIRLVRSCIEAGVLLAGIAMGGRAGIGTLCYAASIGPLVHSLIPRLSLSSRLASSEEGDLA